MSIIKPYTFKGGEKARANEVNENFDVLYTEVNKNISSINNNENSISNLELTKANVNGSTNNVFKVRDPVTSNDAVNRKTLFNNIGNSINLISGMLIAKDTANTNGILVYPGKCYDSTGEYILSLNDITYKENDNQNPNLRYDVFVNSSNNGISSEIVILGEGQTPGNLYRMIGYFYTDTSNYLDVPVSFGTDNNCNELIKIEPDYETGVTSITVPANGSFKITKNGWIVANSAQPNMRINGAVPYILQTYIPAGTTLTSTTAYTFNFLPCKGN